MIIMVVAKGTSLFIWIISIITFVCFVLSFVFWFLYDLYWLFLILGLVVIGYVFIIWSFRDPRREINQDTKRILAPADGRIIEIEERERGIYCVIRMSPFDVHMTRSPVNGTIGKIEFKKGSKWPAYFPKYAKNNQQNRIEINQEIENTQVIVTQVSGIYARRTVEYVTKGEKVAQGDVIGTIRFGSLTSLEVISDKKIKLLRKKSEITRAGLTVIAEFEE